ncbi:MAG: 16S rRNA (guanine(527)-N(7))-methyltransferase RsmG [Casimicrobiaceae bacterium]|nr:16S rRNA (guanine(527)-N(7))-methyltransferase RsmG [Casimicrobiaceae bacterium]MCX8099005.1 16S rRNA (guanine(527)-N(7))-methyltransferase RsmG [Casimicrobiaceae bacterium]MDW8311467.1 16S rRNA (guanine(527)-N(7))-methyltransferase RsmG [Burkholderiales bacterium]
MNAPRRSRSETAQPARKKPAAEQALGRLQPENPSPSRPKREAVEFTPELRLALLERLEQGLERLKLPATERQKQKLIDALALLSQWNAVINLTAIREPEAMLVQHVLDSLAVVPFLPEEATSLLDVGTGGGFPAIPIAILMPELEVVGIDSVRKKTDFVNTVAETLALKNLTAIHGRVEEHPATYDIVLSRAFASLADYVKSAHACLNFDEEALMLAMKGKHPAEEIAELASIGWRVAREEVLTVPFLEAERRLFWLEAAR